MQKTDTLHTVQIAQLPASLQAHALVIVKALQATEQLATPFRVLLSTDELDGLADTLGKYYDLRTLDACRALVRHLNALPGPQVWLLINPDNNALHSNDEVTPKALGGWL